MAILIVETKTIGSEYFMSKKKKSSASKEKESQHRLSVSCTEEDSNRLSLLSDFLRKQGFHNVNNSSVLCAALQAAACDESLTKAFEERQALDKRRLRPTA